VGTIGDDDLGYVGGWGRVRGPGCVLDNEEGRKRRSDMKGLKCADIGHVCLDFDNESNKRSDPDANIKRK